MKINQLGFYPKNMAQVLPFKKQNRTQSSTNSTKLSSSDCLKNYNLFKINFKSNFSLGENFEEITQTNLEKVVPLYAGYQKGMNQTVNHDKIRDFVSEELKSGAQIFSIKENDKNVGFVHFSTTRSTIDMCPFFTIQSVYVDPEHRGKGLAKQLVNKVKDYSIAKNYKGVFVKTHAKNNSSMNMYKNLDFKDESTKYGVFFWVNENVLNYNKGYVNTKN